MCSVECEEGALHQLECQVFLRADFEAEIEDFDQLDDHYAAILPLRCLALKSDPEKWKIFNSFMSHCDGRRKKESMWAYHQEHSVEVLRDLCELGDEVTEEELHRLIGIFSINSLAVELGPGFGEEGAFYPNFSNINHSCVANCRVVKLPGKAVEVRTKARIHARDELTIPYLTELLPTQVRRPLLARKWFFDCCCRRCSSPVECGLHLSSLVCARCQGPLLPTLALAQLSPYWCGACGHTMTQREVGQVEARAQGQFREVVAAEAVPGLETFLHHQSTVLHPGHHLMVSAKMKLGCVYGNLPGDRGRLVDLPR